MMVREDVFAPTRPAFPERHLLRPGWRKHMGAYRSTGKRHRKAYERIPLHGVPKTLVVGEAQDVYRQVRRDLVSDSQLK
jgi:hypothetical protein